MILDQDTATLTFAAGEGALNAFPIEGNGSGDFANLVDADAFMELPRGKVDFEIGEAYPVFLF